MPTLPTQPTPHPGDEDLSTALKYLENQVELESLHRFMDRYSVRGKRRREVTDEMVTKLKNDTLRLSPHSNVTLGFARKILEYCNGHAEPAEDYLLLWC